MASSYIRRQRPDGHHGSAREGHHRHRDQDDAPARPAVPIKPIEWGASFHGSAAATPGVVE